MEFAGFPKIPRLFRECVVTEKIDGTNAQVYISDPVRFALTSIPAVLETYLAAVPTENQGEYILLKAGSRNRWVRPGKEDNAGFAGWVQQNVNELVKLGPGQHFGEWWGSGIQRRYGLNEKRFSLFNTFRWSDAYEAMKAGHDNDFPKCCHVVPMIYKGPFSTGIITAAIEGLNNHGSHAAPGFMDPEGIIVYHEASRGMFKVTCKDDEKAKGEK